MEGEAAKSFILFLSALVHSVDASSSLLFFFIVNLIGLINDRAFKCKTIAWLLIDEWLQPADEDDSRRARGGDLSHSWSVAVVSANSQLVGNKCVVIEIATDYRLYMLFVTYIVSCLDNNTLSGWYLFPDDHLLFLHNPALFFTAFSVYCLWSPRDESKLAINCWTAELVSNLQKTDKCLFG